MCKNGARIFFQSDIIEFSGHSILTKPLRNGLNDLLKFWSKLINRFENKSLTIFHTPNVMPGYG